MKLVSFRSLSGSVVAVALIAACAGTSDDNTLAPDEAGTPTDSGNHDSAVDAGNKDSGTKDSGNGNGCVSHCNTDLDCQNSCPDAGSGTNCCGSGICYVVTQSTCPSGNDAASE